MYNTIIIISYYYRHRHRHRQNLLVTANIEEIARLWKGCCETHSEV